MTYSLAIFAFSFVLIYDVTVLPVFPPFTAKEIKGSTLLTFSPEDIKYELEDFSIEDRMHLRNFLREIVSL